MDKMECPHCKQQTWAAHNCTFCSKELNVVTGAAYDTEREAHAAAYRAEAAHHSQSTLAIASVSLVRQLPGGMLLGRKRLVVPDGTQALVLVDGKPPTKLDPGPYKVTATGVSSNPLAGILAALTGGFAMICEVIDTEFPVTLAVPDLILLRNERDEVDEAAGAVDIEAAYTSAGLLTADDMLGGVEVQLRLRCTDPLKLFNHLIASHASFRAHEDKVAGLRGSDRSGVGVLQALMLPVAVIGQVLFGPTAMERMGSWNSGNAPIDAFKFHVDELFTRLRNEFLMALRAGLRHETVQSLYDTVEVRERVAADIATAMRRSLELYGIALEQVVSFHFRCPEYDKLRARRGQIAIGKESLVDQKIQVEIAKQGRDVTAQEVTHAITTEEKLARHEIDEGTETQAARDRAAAAKQEGTLVRDAAQQNHRRTQEQLDDEQAIKADRARNEAQHEKLAGLLDLYKLQRVYELEWLEKWARLVAELQLSPESTVAIMLLNNPGLAGVLVEMKRVAGLEQMLAQREQFEARFVEVLGRDREQIGRLMDEAVRQFGNVMAKRAEAARPQIVATSSGLVPVKPLTDPPPPPPGDTQPPPSTDNGGP